MTTKTTAALAVMLTATACTGAGGARPAGPGAAPAPVPAPARAVPVSTIVNALKCELRDTFTRHPELRALLKPGEGVGGTLTLTDVVADETAGSLGLEVKPLGIGFGPKIKQARGTTATDAVTLAFSYDVYGTGPAAACASGADVPLIRGHPFVTLLGGLNAEYARIARGAPLITLSKLSYTAGFDVERSEEGGVELSFAVFAVEGSRTRTRTASQGLTLDFMLDAVTAMPPLVPLSPP